MSFCQHRSGGVAALIAVLLVAACGGPAPTASPSPSSAPSPAVSASPAPSASSTPPASAPATPSGSPAADACSDATGAASPSPLPAASDANAALYTRIEGQVEQLRGLKARTPVKRNVLDPAGLCAFLRRSIATSNPPDLVAATDRLYKQLLLIPEDASLSKLYLDLMASQAIGLYDDTTKQMYVVSTTGTIGPVEQITYAHEFDHALQDQAFGLEKVHGTATDQGDRSLARTTLIEGDATLLMSLWAQRNLTAEQLGQVVSAGDPASTAALDAAPPILKDSLMFPYTSGLTLALGAWQQGGFAAVDDLFRNPPDTTEQVMHADKLASREPAIPVALPADLAARVGSGWKVALQDTFGEFQLGILARTGNPDAGTDPAVGWGGDRVALLEGPDAETAAVIDMRWDSSQAGADALRTFQPLLAKLQAAGRHAALLQPAPNRVVLVSADTDATLGRVTQALGLAG